MGKCRLKKNPLQHWPLYASLLILSLLFGLLLATSFYQNQRHLVYALDDAYIHMAMARNFSRYGVWGVTRYGFTSSSSSILWTLLLSLTYYLFGVSQIAPLAWNVLFAVLVLWVAYAILTWYELPPWLKFAALLAIIFLIPLPTLILSGLEQNLQTLLALLAAFLAARILSREAPSCTLRDSTLLLALAPLVTAVRFEGMFLILAIGALLLLRQRWFYALDFAVCGFLPVLIYGIISVSRGWFWLPSSVLLKGMMPDLSSLSRLFLSLAINAFVNLHVGMHVFVLLIAVLLFYILAFGKGGDVLDSRQLMGAILLLTAVPHVEFVRVSPLFRYDAYLFALGVVFLASQLLIVVPDLQTQISFSRGLVPKYLAGSGPMKNVKPAGADLKVGATPTFSRELVSKYVAVGALALLLLFPLAVKGARLLWFLPQCTNNIFEQQYQMGSFVRQYYQGSAVALNDDGAVNFLADIHCLDLWGLANRDVTSLKREHNYHTRDIVALAKQAGARVAIVYDYWYADQVGGLPPEWVQVGQWRIRNNVILGGDTVSFYALDASEVSHLTQCLREFALRLPRDVVQSGSYLEPRGTAATP
jgi:hypothetical protein